MLDRECGNSIRPSIRKKRFQLRPLARCARFVVKEVRKGLIRSVPFLRRSRHAAMPPSAGTLTDTLANALDAHNRS